MGALRRTRCRRYFFWYAIVMVSGVVVFVSPAFSDKLGYEEALAGVRTLAEEHTSDPVIQELYIRYSMKYWELCSDVGDPAELLAGRERMLAFQKEPKDPEEEKYVTARIRELLDSEPVNWDEVCEVLWVTRLGFSNSELVRASEEIIGRAAGHEGKNVPIDVARAAALAMGLLARTQDEEQIARLVQATTPEFWGLPEDLNRQPTTRSKIEFALLRAAANAIFHELPLDLAEPTLAQLEAMNPQAEGALPGTIGSALASKIHRMNTQVKLMRRAPAKRGEGEQ